MAEILEFPGFVDVHVHFREPGMERAETMRTGAEAARLGGFAAVVTMPNTTPAGDSEAYLRSQIEAENLPVKIYPSACITKGRLGREVAELERLADAGAAFFTDDGTYVADDKVMEEAMRRIARLGMVACQHALKANGGVIRDCALARKLHLPTVPVSAETDAIRRDISICRVTGCRLHIQHISTAEGVSLVRNAQREGLPVTAEATPHHLLFAADELSADDANYKMAPPLGNSEDRAELRRAVREGAIMFATDHAPHPEDFKNRGFRASANGITGLEAAIGATYRAMVEEEGMPVNDWARAWWEMPRAIVRGNFDDLGATRVIAGEVYRFDAEASASLSRNSPYGGMEFSCRPQV